MVKYIIYASSNGSLRAVKYFIDKGRKPHISHNGKTPLLCAAEAGHDEIVAYLLQFEEVQADLKKQEEVVNASASPLLIAAQNGHTKCVTLLLQNRGSVYQRDYKDRNCLMIAIQNHHKATALAILSVKNGLEALKTNKNGLEALKTNKNGLEALKTSPTPLQLLIKEMPELAEYVMNKCITQAGEDQPVKYNFDILEDQVPHEHHDHYTLVCMIEYKRLELLHHPLVKDFFFQQFWVKTFPLYVFKLLLYCLFLVALNWFAVVLPRPGPDSETCQIKDDIQILAATATVGQNGDSRKFLATTALCLCILLSFIGLLVEVLQLKNSCWRYYQNPDNLFQLLLYTLTIVFIVSLLMGNENLCSTPWQWHTGTYSVFLSWVNFIFILKYISYTAGPTNMFISTCVKYLKLIFLPIVVASLAFGIPFYMVFVEKSGSLTAFTSPSQAIAKTFVLLAGEFDFEVIFNQGSLLYSPTTYILCIIFLMTVSILFSNLLNALAVGEPLEKLELTTHHLWMKLILEQGWMKGLYTCGDCKTEYGKSVDSSRDTRPWSENLYFRFVLAFIGRGYSGLAEFLLENFGKEYSIHAKIAKELKKKNENFYSEVMAPKPVREDHIVASHKLLQKRSGDSKELPVCHEAGVQTHIESTGLIAGPIHGVEMIGEVEFRVLHQGGSFVWGGYGLRIYVPEGSFPPDIGECRINIKASLSGQFQLPEDSDLLSPIYWISAPCKFTKSLTVEIQHCALGKDKAALSSLSFVSAKCSQRDLPYRFRQVNGGVFTTHSSYGSIQLNHFSGLGITGKKRTLRSYCGHLYYTVKQMYESRFYFVITQDLDARNIVVREHYSNFAKKDATLRIRFESSQITLNIPVDGLVTRKGWRITPFSHPTISRKDADEFEPGQWIPECQLVVQWERKDQTPVPLRHKVDLIGAKSPFDFIHLILDPAGAWQPNQGSIGGSVDYSQATPVLKDLMDALYNKMADKWEPIGIYLHLPMATLRAISAEQQHDPHKCLMGMLEVWLRRVDPPPTWSFIIKAVEFLGEEQLARDLREKYCH